MTLQFLLSAGEVVKGLSSGEGVLSVPSCSVKDILESEGVAGKHIVAVVCTAQKGKLKTSKVCYRTAYET